MSERRDLWYPVVALLAGLGAAAWDVATGRVLLGAVAAVVGVVGCVAALQQTLAKAKDRAAMSGLAAVSFAAALSPASGGRPFALAAAGLLFLAGAVRPTRLPERTRVALLVAAGAFAVLGVVLLLRVLPIPRATATLALAGALSAAVFSWSSRPRPEAPPPKGATIAVFGGSFDPWHRAHRAIAEAALKVASRLLVVVSARPPHKEGAREPSPFHHRVALARLGVEGLPRTEVLEIENRREGPSYTVDTLEALRRLYPPGTEFRLVLGADSFQDFPLWKDWEGILDRAALLVAARPGSDVEPPPEFEGRNAPVMLLAVDADPASSSEIRRRVAAGESLGDLVSPSVAAYIRDHGLFAAGGPGAEEAGAPPPTGDLTGHAGAS